VYRRYFAISNLIENGLKNFFVDCKNIEVLKSLAKDLGIVYKEELETVLALCDLRMDIMEALKLSEENVRNIKTKRIKDMFLRANDEYAWYNKIEFAREAGKNIEKTLLKFEKELLKNIKVWEKDYAVVSKEKVLYIPKELECETRYLIFGLFYGLLGVDILENVMKENTAKLDLNYHRIVTNNMNIAQLKCVYDLLICEVEIKNVLFFKPDVGILAVNNLLAIPSENEMRVSLYSLSTGERIKEISCEEEGEMEDSFRNM